MENIVELDKKQLGLFLKKVRTHLGMTVSQVARESGVAVSHVWNIEAGNKDVALARYFSICQVLGAPIEISLAHATRINRKTLAETVKKEAKHYRALALEKDKKSYDYIEEYTICCASIVLYYLLFPNPFLGLTFEYPSEAIKKIISAIAETSTMLGEAQRRELILRISNTPFQVVSDFGLIDRPLFSDYLSFLIEKARTPDPDLVVEWSTIPKPFEFKRGIPTASLAMCVRANLVGQEISKAAVLDPKLFEDAIKRLGAKKNKTGK